MNLASRFKKSSYRGIDPKVKKDPKPKDWREKALEKIKKRGENINKRLKKEETYVNISDILEYIFNDVPFEVISEEYEIPLETIEQILDQTVEKLNKLQKENSDTQVESVNTTYAGLSGKLGNYRGLIKFTAGSTVPTDNKLDYFFAADFMRTGDIESLKNLLTQVDIEVKNNILNYVDRSQLEI